MKVLIVYDTVSVNRNTEKVASAISGTLKRKGIEVECIYVKEVDPSAIKNYDCVLVGSSTMMWKPTSIIMKFLGSLDSQKFGEFAAAFDTQYRGRFAGNAAKGIEKKLKKLGFKIVVPPFMAYVEGKISNVYLKDGELEKAEKFAEEVVQELSRLRKS